MRILLKFIPFLLIGWAVFASADETSENLGKRLAEELAHRDKGWRDLSVDMEMILLNKSAEVSRRELSLKTLEVENDGDKSLLLFHEPKDVEGTAFLTYTHALEPDEQWLYLPALRRVKRVSSSNKSGPFLGSELAYEDISSFEVSRYAYEYLREENFSNQAYHVVRFFPRYDHSGYSHQDVWIDVNEYRVGKIEYYDRKGAFLKTLVITEYEKYLGKYWRAGVFEVANHQTGKGTRLLWKNYKFGNGFDGNSFTVNALKRVR